MSTQRGAIAAVVVAAAAALGVNGCTEATAPEDGEDVRIELAVTGGIAGVDWSVVIDGETGRVVGGRCNGPVGCDWEPGELLAQVDPGEIRVLASEFFERGFFDGPEEFGSECCDQFDYALSYRDDDDARTVTGSDGTLSEELAGLIRAVQAFVDEARGS